MWSCAKEFTPPTETGPRRHSLSASNAGDVDSLMHRDIPGLCTGTSHVTHVVSPDGSGLALRAPIAFRETIRGSPGIGATPIMPADCFNMRSRTFLKGASIQHSTCHVAART